MAVVAADMPNAEERKKQESNCVGSGGYWVKNRYNEYCDCGTERYPGLDGVLKYIPTNLFSSFLNRNIGFSPNLFFKYSFNLLYLFKFSMNLL